MWSFQYSFIKPWVLLNIRSLNLLSFGLGYFLISFVNKFVFCIILLFLQCRQIYFLFHNLPTSKFIVEVKDFVMTGPPNTFSMFLKKHISADNICILLLINLFQSLVDSVLRLVVWTWRQKVMFNFRIPCERAIKHELVGKLLLMELLLMSGLFTWQFWFVCVNGFSLGYGDWAHYTGQRLS